MSLNSILTESHRKWFTFKINRPKDSATELYKGEKTSKIAVLIEEKPDILTQQMVGMEETQVRSQT